MIGSTSRRMRHATALAFVLWSAQGCVLDEVDLEGARCPCAAGWTCGAGDVCVRDATVRDGGGAEAGSDDGGPADAGPSDAGSIDASFLDASRLDAGSSDGGRPDAGPPDAGPPDGGPDDTACDDVHAGALFCDGFESPAFIAWDEVRTRDGTVTQSTTTRFRGTGAMRAETTAASARADVIASALSAIRAGELWIREYMYVPSGYAIVDMNLTTTHEDVPPYEGVGMGVLAGDRPYLWFGTEFRSVVAPAATIPRDRWFCWELHVVLDDVSGAADLSVDGVTVVTETGVDTIPDGGFTEVVTGIGYVDSSQPRGEIYVDEIVVDDAPIGCE